jgi:hypothetical protein
MPTKFDIYEAVDFYLVDDASPNSTYLLKSEARLADGMTYVNLNGTGFFPMNLPVTRSCHILIVRDGESPSTKIDHYISPSFTLVRKFYFLYHYYFN